VTNDLLSNVETNLTEDVQNASNDATASRLAKNSCAGIFAQINKSGGILTYSLGDPVTITESD
jgi:hypothetical protein